jgi:hypothetical protein
MKPIEAAKLLLKDLDKSNILHFYACKALVNDLNFCVRLLNNLKYYPEELPEIESVLKQLEKLEFTI